TADQTPTIVPCYFMGTIESGQTKTYSVDFTMDGNEDAGGLVGNLAIRGQYGTHDFVINTIVITDAKGKVLVNYDKSGSEETCKIISDFSQLDRADNGNQLTQQGWLVSGIMDDIAAAKYLVIETEGIGDNADGFGGLHLVFQGNDGDPANITIDWTDRALNGNFVNFPRAEGKKVSIAIDLQNVIGDQYDDFLQCTNWARFILAYYGGASAFEGLALTNAYLTKDFDKPEGAVDLSGGTDWGFVFGGYVDCEGTHTSIKTVKSATVSSVYNTDGGIIVNAVNEKVSIYGIDGRLVNQVTANNNFIALSQGLYIVKVGAAKPVKIFVK
ncbi:MAG: T9SS type A sorting domain-containing protein, partial [Candidatus Azobacteroides sp.]|nr:T9SS type A sorting domain-containing protein [Candidatus Azobacteroides sp.]